MYKYVYILSYYDEYGAENVTGTLYRKNLEQLLVEEYKKSIGSEEVTTLRKLLEKSDEELSKADKIDKEDGCPGSDGHNLSEGWGGIQLHVVRLR